MVIVALLLAAFILFIKSQNIIKKQRDFVKETIELSQYGLDYLKANQLPLRDTLDLNLDVDYKTLKVHKDTWGLFEKVTSMATIKNYSFQKMALLGGRQASENRTALYVEDHQKPLVLVGDTHIQGTAFLPKQGIKTGNITGHSYYGSQLIYGTTRTSAPKLPDIDSKVISALKTIKNTLLAPQANFLDVEEGQSYKNSFSKELQLVYSPSPILLRQVELTGHIVVMSDQKVIIDETANLKDILIHAPEIEIKQGVQGRFQAIATNKLIVDKNVNLSYPSSLVLLEEDNTNRNTTKSNHQLIIKGGSLIQGCVVHLGKHVANSYGSLIQLETGATIEGEVYGQQNVELRGKCLGSVYASNFVTREAGSLYQNHLYNAVINIQELPEQFVGLPLNQNSKEVATWLY